MDFKNLTEEEQAYILKKFYMFKSEYIEQAHYTRCKDGAVIMLERECCEGGC